MRDVIELFKAVQTAYADVEAKGKLRDEAAKALHTATEAYNASAGVMVGLQDELNAILGKVLPAPSTRIRS